MWGDPEIPDEAGEDDDDDDDVNIMEEPGTMHPSTLPWPPVYDDDKNPFITIVDVSGIHHLPVCGCICEAADPHINIAYLEVGLFPASFERIQTVFTMDVLKDYRLANLECKTSVYQYYQKLRRLTCPAFPKAVLNRIGNSVGSVGNTGTSFCGKCMAMAMMYLRDPAAMLTWVPRFRIPRAWILMDWSQRRGFLQVPRTMLEENWLCSAQHVRNQG